ncbi:Quinone oxidoreductase-like protein 2 [Pseudomonas reidholzensis]|uniref:Quinone oxidoreductase-like protein 2 n=1 Tax=Pseudomonas reidholzensis TaxID=1785162 RepID=A0A383RT06_9PSED|nr:NADPH:quinone oxidoreductase family protein [Pseudomonas reidholzensis]SYX90209.1 Quinone oxidoreductase-like protein 2 [Pseudomonas reidholzensis]
MKRVETDNLESIEHYRMTVAPDPCPAPGEVLIRIAACGVGYVDALEALGRYQVKPALPHVPGQEVSGWVEALGPGVSGFAPGDRVMTQVHGGFAELTVAPADVLVAIPDGMAFTQAAGFKINYLTALHALRDRGQLQPGETLLVIGAAGGVGSAAVQVGKCLGAKVIAVASTAAKRAFAQALGADHGVDPTAGDFRQQLRELCGQKGPDVVFDPVCGVLFEPAFRALTWGGRHLVVGFAGGEIPALRANLPLLKGASLTGVDVRQFLLYEPDKGGRHLRELLQWVAQGQLVPPIGKVFGFEQFIPALEFALTGAGLGKTVIQISQRS